MHLSNFGPSFPTYDPSRPTQNFVFIIDSPSAEDHYNERYIGKALYTALKSIQIPCEYVEVSNKEFFYKAINEKLCSILKEKAALNPGVNHVPFLHICMHGNTNGLGFTQNDFLPWDQLRTILLELEQKTGYYQNLCFASCNGVYAERMITAHDRACNFIIGNTQEVLQHNVTIAYLAFYGSYYSAPNVNSAFNHLLSSTYDNNFWFIDGEQQRLIKLQNLPNPIFTPLTFSEPFSNSKTYL